MFPNAVKEKIEMRRQQLQERRDMLELALEHRDEELRSVEEREGMESEARQVSLNTARVASHFTLQNPACIAAQSLYADEDYSHIYPLDHISHRTSLPPGFALHDSGCSTAYTPLGRGPRTSANTCVPQGRDGRRSRDCTRLCCPGRAITCGIPG
jgi:hypothetical protein